MKALTYPLALLSSVFCGSVSAGCEPGDTAYIGSICTMVGTYCPRDTQLAAGQLLNINSNPALFAVIGAEYGGDGRTNFALPDLRSRTPVHVGTGPGLDPVFAGFTRGSEVKWVNDVPVHSHAASFTSATTLVKGTVKDFTVPIHANANTTPTSTPSTNSKLTESPGGPAAAAIWSDGSGGVIGEWQLPQFSAEGDYTPAGDVLVSTTENHQQLPVEVLPPQLGVLYCIVTDGVFPPRT
jgi:microcystin-dependent protein